MKWGWMLVGLLVAGCPEPPQETGQVSFNYTLRDGDVSLDCTISTGATIATIRLLLGNDKDGDGELENQDGEIKATVEAPCNVNDANGNGALEANEVGVFGPATVPADTYDLVAIEAIDDTGSLMSWHPFDRLDVATRTSFQQNTIVTANQDTTIPFEGSLQIADELQIIF